MTATRSHVSRLQTSVGNRALSASLIQLSRQETEDEDVAPASEVPRLDPALEAMLTDLFPETQAESFEVISGSTGAQSTSGELTASALRLWRREHIPLDEAYRRSADRSLGPRAQPIAPTRGGTEGSATPTTRWGLLLGAWDYQNVMGRSDDRVQIPGSPPDRPSGNLNDIRRMLRDGSPFSRAAAASYDNHRQIENPTANQMSSAVLEATYQLAAGLAPGQTGHLTVNFQGHGGGGAIEGVDGQVLTRTDLRFLATHAAENGVHITYVLDTCNAGSVALLATNEQMVDVHRRGQQLDEPDREELRSRGRPLVPLARHSLALSDIAYEIRWAKVRTPAERSAATSALERARETIATIRQYSLGHPEIEGLPTVNLLALSADISFRLLLETRFTQRALRASRETLAPVLDDLNGILQREVASLNRLVNSRSSPREESP